MQALVFSAGPGQNWTQIDQLLGMSTHEAVEQHLGGTGVRLSPSQGVSVGDVHNWVGINPDRVHGASRRYYDQDNPASRFLSVLVLD